MQLSHVIQLQNSAFYSEDTKHRGLFPEVEGDIKGLQGSSRFLRSRLGFEPRRDNPRSQNLPLNHDIEGQNFQKKPVLTVQLVEFDYYYSN